MVCQRQMLWHLIYKWIWKHCHFIYIYEAALIWLCCMSWHQTKNHINLKNRTMNVLHMHVLNEDRKKRQFFFTFMRKMYGMYIFNGVYVWHTWIQVFKTMIFPCKNHTIYWMNEQLVYGCGSKVYTRPFYSQFNLNNKFVWSPFYTSALPS